MWALYFYRGVNRGTGLVRVSWDVNHLSQDRHISLTTSFSTTLTGAGLDFSYVAKQQRGGTLALLSGLR